MSAQGMAYMRLSRRVAQTGRHQYLENLGKGKFSSKPRASQGSGLKCRARGLPLGVLGWGPGSQARFCRSEVKKAGSAEAERLAPLRTAAGSHVAISIAARLEGEPAAESLAGR